MEITEQDMVGPLQHQQRLSCWIILQVPVLLLCAFTMLAACSPGKEPASRKGLDLVMCRAPWPSAN